ncbi:MAG: hypothetical protein ABFC31_07815 [Clostridiaceae bacterium]
MNKRFDAFAPLHCPITPECVAALGENLRRWVARFAGAVHPKLACGASTMRSALYARLLADYSPGHNLFEHYIQRRSNCQSQKPRAFMIFFLQNDARQDYFAKNSAFFSIK